MKNGMTKHGQDFVKGISEYIREGGKKSSMVLKIQAILGKISTDAHKEKVAYVESAIVMTDTEKEELRTVLSNIVGHDVSLECTVNHALIAGFRIKIADFVVDTSYSTQIYEMADILMR